MAKIITISFPIDNPDELHVETAGYQGKGCHAVQEAFQRDFGGESKRLTRKPEFNKLPTKNVSITR